MRSSTFLVAAVAIAFASLLLVSRDSRAQEVPGNEIFGALREDIGTFLPAVQQKSFLVRVTLTDRFLFPPTPAFPPSPCAAMAQLDSIASSTQGLAKAGRISQEGEQAILGDVTRLSAGIRAAFPPSPCFHAPDLGD